MQESFINKIDNYSIAIDGLRALAVIAVIINHFNGNLLPSGYLGVDVFFVISGYVITNSLVKRKENNTKEFFISFYKRRIKRLFPALLFCFSVTAILISFFCEDPTDYIITGLYSLPGLANIKLYLNSVDYWGESGHYNPFTHTWSLGVEEQFYFIFPFTLWLVLRGNWNEDKLKKVKFLLIFFCLVSLTGFVYLHPRAEMMAYFLLPFRFWEIGLGCFLYLSLKLSNGTHLKKFLALIPLYFLLFIFLLICFSPKEFALFNTIGIVILTTFFIIKVKILEHESPDGSVKLLTGEWIVYIGKISYSLYLWHWVVIVISKWSIGFSFFAVCIQIILIFALSIFSYHYIEKPLRHSSWRASISPKAILIPMVCIVLFFSAVVNVIPNNNLFYLGNTSNNLSKTAKLSLIEKKTSNCSKIRIVGNSHSIHILPMIKVITEKLNIELVHEKHPNYILIPSARKADSDKIDGVINSLENDDLLIISSRFRYLYEIPYLNYTGKKLVDHAKAKEENGYGLKMWLDELDEIVFKCKNKGIKVVLFLPNIEFDSFVAKDDFCSPQWFRKPAKHCYQVVSKEYLNSRFPKEIYSEVEKRELNNPNFFAFNPIEIYCPDSESKDCSINLNGIRLFSDTNHLTEKGSLIMLDEFYEFLVRNKII